VLGPARLPLLVPSTANRRHPAQHNCPHLTLILLVCLTVDLLSNGLVPVPWTSHFPRPCRVSALQRHCYSIIRTQPPGCASCYSWPEFHSRTVAGTPALVVAAILVLDAGSWTFSHRRSSSSLCCQAISAYQTPRSQTLNLRPCPASACTCPQCCLFPN